MMNNVLILSAGRRVELVIVPLKRWLVSTFIGKVMCTRYGFRNCLLHVWSLMVLKVPRATDKAYIDNLMAICQSNSIKLVIPTIDTDLEKLSRAKDSFSKFGCHISVPEPTFVTACHDKRKRPRICFKG